MEPRLARPADLPAVGALTRQTITEVYPHYYPAGVVDFFLYWHRDAAILPDILAGEVYLLYAGGQEAPGPAVGTVTLHGQEITRLYVPPKYQGRGYGRALLDFAETTIGGAWGSIRVEASLPAKIIYWRRGYRVIDALSEPQANGDVLCWDVMEKPWPSPPEQKPEGESSLEYQ